ARWTTQIVALTSGTYTFSANADDGIRVYVDGGLIIDQWHDASGIVYTASPFLTAGPHTVTVEYYENAGSAFVNVQLPPAATSVADILRIPHYSDVTVQNGGVLTAHAWDGISGGIVAFKSNGTVTVAS